METTTSTPGVRMCHKLTRDHVWLTSFTRMRVYLAAQVSIVYGNPPNVVYGWLYWFKMFRDTVPKNYILFIMVQVMSESVASALEFVDNDATQQTRLFIRMIDRFLICSMWKAHRWRNSNGKTAWLLTQGRQMSGSRWVYMCMLLTCIVTEPWYGFA